MTSLTEQTSDVRKWPRARSERDITRVSGTLSPSSILGGRTTYPFNRSSCSNRSSRSNRWTRFVCSSLSFHLVIVRRFCGCVDADHAAPAEAFAEIPAALIQKSPDRTKLTGAVQPCDRLAPDIHDLSARVSPRPTLSIEETRP